MAFASFKQKIIISAFIALISSFYQLESKDEYNVTEKLVMLSKKRSEIFDYLTNLEDYPRWYPNIERVELIDIHSTMTSEIGKRYKVKNTKLLYLGPDESIITIIGYQKPQLFEFLCDNWLMERNRLQFKEHDANKTMVTWNLYSRRKSLLFRYTIGTFFQFYHSQALREGLFSLQFLMRQ